MANVVIRVEGLSKRYRLGQHHGEESYRSLRDILPRLLARPLKMFQKDEPNAPEAVSEEILWALRDISFDVGQGEIVGIIGRNGAGKSTLLKILSEITSPTSGQAQIYGRVSALLEVGTGFHGELTGRENVYLNGAILGMSKAEIDRLFDDIVAFAEVGHFIDTPLKRYSTGMGMRLAFSVAAHLDPEILLMDEVLAVGDIAFQDKCLAKMSEVAQTGRTILFVSHNMAAIRKFCHRVIVLDHGAVCFDMPSNEAIRSYIQLISKDTNVTVQAFKSRWVAIERIQLLDPDGNRADHFFWSDPVKVQCDWKILESMNQFRMGIMVSNEEGVHLFTSFHLFENLSPGSYRSCMTIPKSTLNANAYLIHLYMDRPLIEVVGLIEPAARFTIQHERIEGEVYDHQQPGVLKIELPWTTEPVEQA